MAPAIPTTERATTGPSPVSDASVSPAQVAAQMNVAQSSERSESVPANEMLSEFIPPGKVDKHAHPLAQPDTTPLDSLEHYSGGPLRVRIYVNQDGLVAQVRVLSSNPGDEHAADVVAHLWQGISFAPAQLANHDVASYVDVDFQIVNPPAHIRAG